MLLGVVACGSESNEAMDFAMLQVERVVSITNEENAPQCSVSLKMDTATWQQGGQARAVNAAIARELLFIDDSTSMKLAADSFASHYTASYRHDMAPFYREDRGDAEKRPWYEYHYDIEAHAKAGRNGTTVYEASIDYYEGGAHGISQLIVLNFDNLTGRQLTLADVLVPGYQQPLNELLLQKLMQLKGTDTIDQLREQGFLYSMDMFAPENFVLRHDGGITFVYNPYEIAPYSEGLIKLELDSDELQKLWKY